MVHYRLLYWVCVCEVVLPPHRGAVVACRAATPPRGGMCSTTAALVDVTVILLRSALHPHPMMSLCRAVPVRRTRSPRLECRHANMGDVCAVACSTQREARVVGFRNPAVLDSGGGICTSATHTTCPPDGRARRTCCFETQSNLVSLGSSSVFGLTAEKSKRAVLTVGMPPCLFMRPVPSRAATLTRTTMGPCGCDSSDQRCPARSVGGSARPGVWFPRCTRH